MSARFPLPNGAVLEIARVIGAAVPFTALTNAKPPVAAAAGHAIQNGAVLLVSSGWAMINDRAVKASNVADDAFSLAGLDTSDIELFTAGAGIGSVLPVSPGNVPALSQTLSNNVTPQFLIIDVTGY